jgi:hypothetical protein
MHGANAINGLLRKVCWTKGGCSKEVGGALEATPRISAVIRVLCDTSHRKWM